MFYDEATLPQRALNFSSSVVLHYKKHSKCCVRSLTLLFIDSFICIQVKHQAVKTPFKDQRRTLSKKLEEVMGVFQTEPITVTVSNTIVSIMLS